MLFWCSSNVETWMQDQTVDVGPGELPIVPRCIEHQPFAAEDTHLLLIEPTGPPDTGDPATAQPRRMMPNVQS